MPVLIIKMAKTIDSIVHIKDILCQKKSIGVILRNIVATSQLLLSKLINIRIIIDLISDLCIIPDEELDPV